MSGPLKVYGKAFCLQSKWLWAWNWFLWRQQTNPNEGPLTLITLDTKGDPQRALAQLDLLVDKYRYGNDWRPSPDTALPVALRAQAYQLPIISLSHRANLPP